MTTETVTVTQADRVAAAALADYHGFDYHQEIRDGLADCIEDVEAFARHRIEATRELEAKLLAPGVLRCAKCDFRLIKTTLTPAGAFANNTPDTCPNCNVPMWRISWEDEAKEAFRVAESQMNRALEAEAQLAEARGLLEKVVAFEEDHTDPSVVAKHPFLNEARAFLSRTGGEA